MSPPPSTRSKAKSVYKDSAEVEAKNRPEVGAAPNINKNTADSSQGGTGGPSTSTDNTTVPGIAEMISKEVSKANLSGEMLALVNIISQVIQSQFDNYLTRLDNLNSAKTKQIDELQTKISALENKVFQLESLIDDVDQYERRDTVIVSGPSLPDETTMENPTEIIVNTIKHHLHVNMTQSDVNVAHRLGPKTQGKKRPIIVKLQNRAKKSELVQACITIRPQLHINESLTPKRRALYSVIRKLRAQHRHLFQQCYTSDGKIIIKLKNSSVKYTITSEQTLTAFLDNHPLLKEAAGGDTGGL